jgi:hypothetical protein
LLLPCSSPVSAILFSPFSVLAPPFSPYSSTVHKCTRQLPLTSHRTRSSLAAKTSRVKPAKRPPNHHQIACEHRLTAIEHTVQPRSQTRLREIHAHFKKRSPTCAKMTQTTAQIISSSQIISLLFFLIQIWSFFATPFFRPQNFPPSSNHSFSNLPHRPGQNIS